jgi:hypothetical protein
MFYQMLVYSRNIKHFEIKPTLIQTYFHFKLTFRNKQDIIKILKQVKIFKMNSNHYDNLKYKHLKNVHSKKYRET